MIVFDRKEKEIKVPEGLGNINLTVVDANLEDKTVKIKEVETTILPSSGYNGMSSIEVNARDVYDIGYGAGNSSGFYEGRDYQRQLLTSISINKNGTYRRPNGYNEIVVEVEDTNGDYQTGFDEGYSSGSTEGFNLGYTSGRTDGYNIGYNEGEENGVANAGEIIAQTARVLDITENGTYVSQYSDPILPTEITGVYSNGENFYNYAKLDGAVYDTDIRGNQNTKLEFWWKPDGEFNMYYTIIGFQVDSGMIMKICETYSANELKYEYGLNAENQGTFTINDDWNHIIFSKADGLIVNGIKIADLTANWYGDVYPNVFINASYRNEISSNANGYFGMIKITTNGVENIIIPTEKYFQNITTNQTLLIIKGGSYSFTDNQPIIPEGNLIKTVNVNVQPKLDIGEMGIKFGYSGFKKIPDGLIDWSKISDMSYMFANSQIHTLEGIDFTNINEMSDAFNTTPLQNLDGFNPGERLMYMNRAFMRTQIKIVPNLDLHNVLNLSSLFEECQLEEVGDLHLESVGSIDGIFWGYGGMQSLRKIGAFYVPNIVSAIGDLFYYGFVDFTLPDLTEMGGLIGLKGSWISTRGLNIMPNLTYQSCINILNGLYDFTGNGETPNTDQGQLRVHPNFLTTVGDEINIAISKGWTLLTD